MIQVRDPTFLDRAAVESIVREIQEVIYLDLGPDSTPAWNPEKECSGGDVVELVSDVLLRHGLNPREAGQGASCPT